MEATIYTDGTYLRNNPSWHAGDAAWKASHILGMLERHGLSPRSVCEVGCGSGDVVRALSQHLPRASFVGCDVSPDAIALCRDKSGTNLDYRLGDALDHPQRFDLALALDVFEHVEDCFGFLRKLRTKAEHKLFHIPLDLSALSVMRSDKLLAMRRQVGHLHYFTRDTALALLEDTGHRIVDHFYTAGATDRGYRGWKTRLLKGPRRALFAVNRDAAARLFGGYSLMVLAR